MPTFIEEGHRLWSDVYLPLCVCWYLICGLVLSFFVCYNWGGLFDRRVPVLFVLVVCWARFSCFLVLATAQEGGEEVDFSVIEAANSSPSLLFMGCVYNMVYSLASPYMPTIDQKERHVRVGFILFFATFLFLVAILSVSYLPFAEGGTFIEMGVWVLYFFYYLSGAIGLAYGRWAHHTQLERFQVKHDKTNYTLILCIILLAFRAVVMLVGASSSLSFFFLDFGGENTTVPYFYYVLLDLFPLVLFVWVVKWKGELHEKIEHLSSVIPLLPKENQVVLKSQINVFSELPQINPSSLQLHEAVGGGSFSTVYRATWKGTVVAVKHFHLPMSFATSEDLKEIAEEMKLLSHARHPNILRYLGTTPPPWLSIVTEYMGLLSLDCIITNPKYHETLKEVGRQEMILLQIAKGMTYLHRSGILHRDLCPNNVLVNTEWEIKIGDLGLAKLKTSNPSTTSSTFQNNLTGNTSYIAPEVLSGEFYPASDVFSFGVLIWHVLTLQEPWSNANLTVMALFRRVRAGERPPIPRDYPEFFRQLTAECWHPNWERRPPFEAILRGLEEASQGEGRGEEGGEEIGEGGGGKDKGKELEEENKKIWRRECNEMLGEEQEML